MPTANFLREEVEERPQDCAEEKAIKTVEERRFSAASRPQFIRALAPVQKTTARSFQIRAGLPMGEGNTTINKPFYAPFEHTDNDVLSWKLSHPLTEVLVGAPK